MCVGEFSILSNISKVSIREVNDIHIHSTFLQVNGNVSSCGVTRRLEAFYTRWRCCLYTGLSTGATMDTVVD